MTFTLAVFIFFCTGSNTRNLKCWEQFFVLANILSREKNVIKMYKMSKMSQGFKNQKSWYMFFGACDSMVAHTIMHITFCAPQIVVCAHMYADMYLVELQRNILEQKVNLRSIPLTMNPEPSLGIQTVFHRERNNIWVSCLPRTKQPDNFLSTVFESNEHGLYFPVFVDLRQKSCQ